jgi:hypothetical protein
MNQMHIFTNIVSSTNTHAKKSPEKLGDQPEPNVFLNTSTVQTPMSKWV